MVKSTYFTGNEIIANGAAQTSNITTSDDVGVTGKAYGVRLTTGNADKLVIDICGGTLPQYFRVRCDVTDNNIITNNREYVTDFFDRNAKSAGGDVSAVSGDIAANSANIGAKIPTMSEMPFYFRGLGTAGFRVVFTDGALVKNGQSVNVYVEGNSSSTASNFLLSGADVSFDQSTDCPPNALINGGPSGTGSEAGLPLFSAKLVKNPTSPSNADFYIMSEKPFFSNGGEGIGLKKAFFRRREYIQGSVGPESYTSLSKPATETKNADGLYEYKVESNITDGTTKAYLITCTRVEDDFGATANVQQTTETNEPILVENKAAALDVNTFDLSGASIPGGKMVVKFKGNNAPEGFTTIKRYSVYYLNREQASDICSNRASPSTDFKLKFPLVKAMAELKGQVKHLEADKIKYAAYNTEQSLTIDGIANSSTTNNNSTYSVYITASTQKDGQFVEGAGPADSDFNDLDSSPAQADASNIGVYISGAPAAATSALVRVGKNISSAAAGNNAAADTAMDQKLNLFFNDYQVDQRGDDYAAFRYAIIKADQVQYANNEFTLDSSFVRVGKSYDGTSALENEIITATGANGVLYNYANAKWNAVAADNTRDVANGESYAIKFALENKAGMGDFSEWLPFTPQTLPDATDDLFSADPSGGDSASHFGKVLVSSTSNQLKHSEVTQAAQANLQGLAVDGESISVGWSLKTANQIKKNLDASASLTGGSSITSVRYNIEEMTNTFDGIRLFGAQQKPLNKAKSLVPRVSNDTDKLKVVSGIDASGFETGLRQGQRYDISFSLVNANGYNDLTAAQIEGFAPMGTLMAPGNMREGSAKPKVEAAGAGVDPSNVTVDICFNDISGVSQHGGHLPTAYDIKVEQIVNGATTILRNFVADATASGRVLDASMAGITQTTVNRALSVTTTGGGCIAGYPLKVSLKAIARAAAANDYDSNGDNNNDAVNNAAEADNLLYNPLGKTVNGAVAVITTSPVLMTGTVHDEVRSLQATSKDKALEITWSSPELTAVIKSNLDAPVVRHYKLYAYDMSLTDVTTPAVSSVANAEIYQEVDPNGSAKQSDGSYKTTISGLRNGGAYMIVVKTRWGYGPGKSLDLTTSGMYHTDNLDGAHALNVVEKDGKYQWYAAGDPLGQSTANNATTLPLVNNTNNLAVPSGKPVIIYDRDADPKKLIISDNGAALSDALLLQLSPGDYATTGTNAFKQDLTAGSAMTSKNVRVDGEITIVKESTVASATLGSAWVTEKNIVIAANAKGADHRVIG